MLNVKVLTNRDLSLLQTNERWKTRNKQWSGTNHEFKSQVSLLLTVWPGKFQKPSLPMSSHLQQE